MTLLPRSRRSNTPACPFFTIAIRLEHSRLFWQLTGSDDVKQFIRIEFAHWFS